MVKRAAVHLDEVADLNHLAWAFWRAALGKRDRPEVCEFAAHLDDNLDRLRSDLLAETIEVGHCHCFEIVDPKLRTIHAPCFRERVVHHALMAHLEPVFERYFVEATFACRVGKGSRAAVLWAQKYSRRFPWYLKIDIKSYFASVDHALLRHMVRRRVKGTPVLRLIDRIIEAHETAPGRGLPIGALTSQHFANLYLAALDRFLLEDLKVPGIVRYMDDTVIWHRSRRALRAVFEEVRAFAHNALELEIKNTWQLQRTCRGLTLCGHRIHPGRILLTARCRRRYWQCRSKWEAAWRAGQIDAIGLQAAYASALAMTCGADAAAWRRGQHRIHPPLDV